MIRTFLFIFFVFKVDVYKTEENDLKYCQTREILDQGNNLSSYSNVNCYQKRHVVCIMAHLRYAPVICNHGCTYDEGRTAEIMTFNRPTIRPTPRK